jgi:hypothetical protein
MRLARALVWAADKISRGRVRVRERPAAAPRPSAFKLLAPRPLLLVEQERIDGPTADVDLLELLTLEGYLVIMCGPRQFRSLRVIAPCPFVEADVERLRALAGACGAGSEVDQMVLRSIADRMSGMLAAPWLS